jgi:GMP synthase (glutamine-hydrolysing)
VEYIRERVNANEVLCAVSGGVDSSILAVLVEKAVHKKAHFVFVNTGLLREGEVDEVNSNLKKYIDLEIIDAKDKFISNLKEITDPEEKRKIIGHTFIEIFDEYASSNKNIKYLAQGTLYPDLIESKSVTGPSDEIKTHHNVGGLPEFMKLELIEPFKFLFKDEVRKVGAELGISEDILNRHPFPGPGLAVRIIGEVTEQRLEILRKADKIAIDTLKKYNLYNDIAQAIVVLLPVKSVGVMGDKRTYENPCVLRFVTTNDFMTADWAKIPPEVLSEISTRITNEVNGINRVIYDITTKPPATIEWE